MNELKLATSFVLRICLSRGGKKPLPRELAELVASIMALSCLSSPGVFPSGKRLSFPEKTKMRIKSMARIIQWMTDPKRHQGQQASEIAKKTLRGIKSGFMDAETLMKFCDDFSSVRHGHIVRNSEKRIRVSNFDKSNGVYRARPVRSLYEMRTIGFEMENCLRDREQSHHYRKRLRHGEIGLVKIEEIKSNKPVVLISFNPATSTVEEINGQKNSRPIKFRRTIIQVLRILELEVGTCENAMKLGICDRLIKGQIGAPEIHVGSWHYEFGYRCIAMTSGSCAALIQLGPEDSFSRSSLFVTDFKGHKEFCEDNETVAAFGSQVRFKRHASVLTYRAHAESEELADLCRTAFIDAPDLFVRDWLGSVSSRASKNRVE